MKRIFAWICIIFGVLLALAGVVGPQSQQGDDPRLVIFIIGGLFCTAGVGLLQKKKQSAFGSRVGEAKKGKPAGYSTKNCPECEEHLPLNAEVCPKCERKQKKNDSTCSGGVNTAAQGRSDFTQERRRAKSVDSPGYIWRTAQDGSVCERCAANNGYKFSWDEEPSGGHAGAKTRCRCYPEPIITRD